jgi:hypothetical protein
MTTDKRRIKQTFLLCPAAAIAPGAEDEDNGPEDNELLFSPPGAANADCWEAA